MLYKRYILSLFLSISYLSLVDTGFISAQSNQCNLTTEKYQILQEALKDDDLFDDKKPQITVSNVSGILGCSGNLIRESSNTQVFRWQDRYKPYRAIQATFENGIMVIWKGQGFN